jgi:ABC-type polysaccharide/polyol phosphate export permease
MTRSWLRANLDVVPKMNSNPTNWARVARQSWVLTKANLKSRYRSTTAGMLWVLMAPAILYSAQSFAFHYILKIQVQNYPVFLLASLLPWIFISSTAEMSVGIYVNNGRFIKSYRIEPLALVLAQIFDNFINYYLSVILMMIPILYFFDVHVIQLWRILIPQLVLVVFVSGFAVLVATTHVFFRDTRFVLTFLMQVSFYLTPIFYPKELIPPQLSWVSTVNPFSAILAPFQSVALPELRENYWTLVMQSAGVAIGTFALAIFVWRRKKNAVFFQV